MVKLVCALVAFATCICTTMASTGDSGHGRSAVWQASGQFMASLQYPSLAAQAAALLAVKKSAKATDSSALPLDDKAKHAIAFVEKQMKAYGIPGVGLSVVYQHKTAISQGLGVTTVNTSQPVLPTTQFAIAELSQSMLALAVGKFVESHRLEWDDPVQMYLPWFALLDEYAGNHTTIGDLLAMNSVIDLEDGLQPNAYGVHTTDRTIVEALGHLKTSHAFRSGYDPSQFNLDILGQVIEAVTSQPWHAYVLDAVAKPLHMHDTVGRPADAAPTQVTAAHFMCDAKTVGPYPLANSTITAIRPHDAYVAGSSMVSSINDLTKLSLALLGSHPLGQDRSPHHEVKKHALFDSSKPLGAMTTGQSFNKMLEGIVPLAGKSYSSAGNSLAAGYGFDTVGDVMHGHHYFGIMGYHVSAGFVPAHGLGVVLTSNAIASGGNFSATAILEIMQSYLHGLYLDVPIATLDREFAASIDACDVSRPARPCDAHFFDSQPWDTPGLVIPDKTKHALVGTYVADKSPLFNGNVTVYIDPTGDKNLMLRYGEYASRLIATEADGVFIWALEIRASTIHMGFTHMEGPSPKLRFPMMSFTRERKLTA